MTRFKDLRAAGLSVQRISQWTYQGLLRADNPRPGYGKPRTWLPGEDKIAAVMLLLVEAGVSPVAAAKAARNDGYLAPGIRVVMDEEAA